MKKTPLNAVKDQFQSKEQLIAAVRALATPELWLDRVSKTKGLERISNGKLLRLHEHLTMAKDRFGSRTKLIDAILELSKRAKDQGWRSRLESFPLPRLLDLQKSLAQKAKAAVK